MVELNITCPSCGAKVKIEKNKKRINCEFCQTLISYPNSNKNQGFDSDLTISSLPLVYRTLAINPADAILKVKSDLSGRGGKQRDLIENGTIVKSMLLEVPYIRFSVEYDAKCFCQIGKEKINFRDVTSLGGTTSYQKVIDLEYEPWEGKRDGIYCDDLLVGKFDELADDKNFCITGLPFLGEWCDNGEIFFEEGWENNSDIQQRYKEKLDSKISDLELDTLFEEYIRNKLEKHIKDVMPSPSRNNYSQYQYRITDITPYQANYLIEVYEKQDFSLTYIISLSTGQWCWWGSNNNSIQNTKFSSGIINYWYVGFILLALIALFSYLNNGKGDNSENLNLKADNGPNSKENNRPDIIQQDSFKEQTHNNIPPKTAHCNAVKFIKSIGFEGIIKIVSEEVSSSSGEDVKCNIITRLIAKDCYNKFNQMVKNYIKFNRDKVILTGKDAGGYAYEYEASGHYEVIQFFSSIARLAAEQNPIAEDTSWQYTASIKNNKFKDVNMQPPYGGGIFYSMKPTLQVGVLNEICKYGKLDPNSFDIAISKPTHLSIKIGREFFAQ